MFWDIYHDGRFLGRFMHTFADYAMTEAARRFRLSYWELEAIEVEG